MADIEVSCDLQNKKDINASFSDVIDINLQKEIKMGIELNAPLYIGADTNLQQQVTQNTADIADLKQDVSDIETDIGNLNNLDTVDKSSVVNAINEALSVLDPTQTADYINNSKGLKSGDVSTNSIILNDIKDYAHSTFDLSKFTVVGSPTIADDGIASGFSTSNYLTTRLTFTPTSELKYTCKFTTGSNITNYQVLFRLYNNLTGNYETNALAINSGNIRAQFKDNYNAQYPCQANTTYYVEMLFTLNKSEAKIYDNSGNLLTTLTYTASPILMEANNSIFTTGIQTNDETIFNSPFLGSVDLKQFSITADGVEVFSGNKTGIDTIKPDDYTVVGTPTISADGVASGFSTSNYLTAQNLNLANYNEWEITTKVKYLSYSSTQIIFNLFNNNLNTAFGNIQTSGKVKFAVWETPSGGATGMLFEYTSSYTLTNNTEYFIKFKFAGNKYEVGFSTDGISYTWETASNSSTRSNASGILRLGLGNGTLPFNGSFDLNGFKIYVDGDLVYQPCLKIPYTESKTGSKIVNAIYRDRVNDMAEQFGYANYYTLSDTDFTLPQVELYGLIGQRTLRDSYRNGINYWEFYSNRDLEQGGSCTSGVEVTFTRPFADTNYVLSVPYSAKSATAFTPTQTGDWIAKGKGIL